MRKTFLDVGVDFWFGAGHRYIEAFSGDANFTSQVVFLGSSCVEGG